MALFEKRERLDCGYELFIAAVSVLSVFNLFLIYIPGVDQDAINVVYMVNVVLTLLFMYDFAVRFTTAPSRSFYFFRNYGWADLLAILPILRILRLFRILKAYRLVSKYGIRKLHRYLSTHRAESALYILVFAVILIIETGSYLVLIAESSSASANITTASDAMWWAYVTITTVGYGDQYPVTPAGRMVGVMVMTMGVAVFATFAGYISSKLLSPAVKEEEASEQAPAGEDQASRYLAELKHLLGEREKIETEIASRLENLERLFSRSALSGQALDEPGI
jgi:voltage-gated potassium channel